MSIMSVELMTSYPQFPVQLIWFSFSHDDAERAFVQSFTFKESEEECEILEVMKVIFF